MKAGFVIALLAIAMLCVSSLAQEMTADDWYKKGQSLIATGFGYNIDEALEAFDNAIQIEPQNIDAWLGKAKSLAYLDKKNESLEAFRNILNLTNKTIKENPDDAKAWQSKGIALASLGRGAEATDAFERSIELLNKSLQSDPKDAEAWWLKAENLELLGRIDSALEAYDKVIELNSSEVGAWLRKSDIFYGLPGGYNQSQDAFGKAVDLMGVNSTSFISFWYPEGDHTIILNEWMIDGQIVRVDFGRYNRSIQAYDDLVQTRTNSGLFAAWQNKGRAITPLDTTLGKPSEYLLGSSPNWVVYNFTRADFPGNKGSADLQDDSSEDNSAEDWFNRGQGLARNGSLLDAVSAYDKAIDQNPGNLDARLNKAMALHQAGKVDESDLARDEAIKAAISYLGDLNQSSRVFDKVVEPVTSSSPAKLAEAWDYRGFLLADLAGPLSNNMSMYEEAIKYFDRAVELDPQRTEAWIFKGSVLDTRLNRSAEAILAYDKAIELDGENAIDNESLSNAWSGKGTALAKLGRYNESFEAFDKAIELNLQASAFVWLAKGDALNQSGRYEEAAFAYDKVVEQNPDSSQALIAHAYGSKGDALSAWGKYDEAVIAYDNAIENYPSEPMGAQTWHKKGIALQALGRTSDADAAFAKAKELGYQTQEDSVDYWLKRGQELYDNGSYEESTQAYEKAISLDPNNSSAWLGKGESLILRRNYEALAALNKSLELDPQNADAWNSKGSVLFINGQKDEALVIHEKALEITNATLKKSPQDVRAWQSRAAALSGLGRLDEYRKATEKIIEIYNQTLDANPQDIEAWWGKALYLSALGRNEEALQAYDRIIELNSTKSARAWVFKAYIFDPQGRYNESLQAYDRAIELTPVDEYWRLANIWDQKGLTLQRISSLEAANEAFEKAALNYGAYLQKNPNSSEAWKNMGQDLYNLGRYEEALDAYDEAIESGQNYGLFFRAMLWNGKGKALQAMGKDREAAVAFSKAKELGYQE